MQEDIVVSESQATTELIDVQTQQDVTEALRTTNRTAFTKMQVLEMYKQAVDSVKLHCPGFTRTIDNEIHKTATSGNNDELLNAVISILAEDDHAADSVVSVEKNDDLGCRIYFPVYDTDYGCMFYDGASVRDAMCYDNGQTYDIIILFYEQTTENGISNEFSQMMTPFSQETLMRNLNSYFPALHENNCDTSLRYYNCEILCRIDKNSGHIQSLQQKMITQVNMNVNFDLVLTESSFSAQATMVNHLAFSDFNWN